MQFGAVVIAGEAVPSLRGSSCKGYTGSLWDQRSLSACVKLEALPH